MQLSSGVLHFNINDTALTYNNINSLVTTTLTVSLSLPIGLVTAHVYAPLSLVVTLLIVYVVSLKINSSIIMG